MPFKVEFSFAGEVVEEIAVSDDMVMEWIGETCPYPAAAHHQLDKIRAIKALCEWLRVNGGEKVEIYEV